MKISRALVLTHLRPGTDYFFNRAFCAKAWDLYDPAFNGRAFKKRILVVDPDSLRPREIKLGPGDITAYSRRGVLYNLTTVPPTRKRMQPPATTGAVWGAITARKPVFFLGGGDLTHGLFNTFESLFRMKLYKGESLQMVIPLTMTYSSRVNDPEKYIFTGNSYHDALLYLFKHRLISALSITINGNSFIKEEQITPYNNKIELHWFTLFDRLLTSPFFPELNIAQTLDRIRLACSI